MDSDNGNSNALQAELDALKAQDPEKYLAFLSELKEKTETFNTLLDEALQDT